MRASRQTLFRTLIACALAGSTAAPALAGETVPTSRQIRYDDLDLTSAKGVARLNTRVRSAARSICAYRGYGPMQEDRLTLPCVAEVLRRAAPDVDLAILSQRDSQFAARATTLTIGVAR